MEPKGQPDLNNSTPAKHLCEMHRYMGSVPHWGCGCDPAKERKKYRTDEELAAIRKETVYETPYVQSGFQIYC